MLLHHVDTKRCQTGIAVTNTVDIISSQDYKKKQDKPSNYLTVILDEESPQKKDVTIISSIFLVTNILLNEVLLETHERQICYTVSCYMWLLRLVTRNNKVKTEHNETTL